MKLRKEKSFN